MKGHKKLETSDLFSMDTHIAFTLLGLLHSAKTQENMMGFFAEGNVYSLAYFAYYQATGHTLQVSSNVRATTSKGPH